jgi:membrane associated rhomboid family serine protease
MSYSSRSPVNRNIPSSRFPVGLKWLLISNIGIFVVYFFLYQTDFGSFFRNFWLVPAQVVSTFAVWQLVTYMFMHSYGNFGHILWNMLALWMFGVELERLWGTGRFLRYYFACGVGAGICVVISAYAFSVDPNIPTLGSSGAVYGILLAYALLFPDRIMLFGFLIPIKVKYFVMIIGAITFMQSYLVTVGGQRSGVAVVAHLGGLVVGYLLLRGTRLKRAVEQPVLGAYKDWKLRRAKKKFEVYLRKKDSDHDRWVN